MGSITFCGQLQRNANSLLQYVPILGSPALKPDEYAVDEKLLLARTICGVALSFIAMAALYWTCPAVALFTAKHETISLFGTVILAYLPGLIERTRANLAATRLAIHAYADPMPSSQATNRICSSPAAFQRLLNSHADLNKLDGSGMNLPTKIVRQGSPKVCQVLVDSEIDLLAVNGEGVSLFMHAVERWSDPAILQHILESGKVQAANLGEQAQAAIWKHVQHPQTVELLHRYGFNINARDAAGITPLMYWTTNPRLAVAALNAGADPRLQNPQGVKASELAAPNSLLRSLLLQAEREFVSGQVHLPKERGFMAWLPWRPMVRKGTFSFEVNSDELLRRISAVVMAGLALVCFAPHSMMSVVSKVLIAGGAVSVPLFIAEVWRGEKEAERQAVIEYLTSPVPSNQSTRTICRSMSAVRLLAQHAPAASYLSKVDEEGYSLLSNSNTDPEAFKLLVSRGADIFAGFRQSGLSQAVKASSPDLLTYIARYKLAEIQAMPVERQVEMWSSVGSEQVARRLLDCGLNPNVSDAEGNTALMRLAQQRNALGDVPLGKIQALLAVGANRSLQNHAGQTARDLAVDPRVAALL